ncbi:hypothetical protein Aph02nite_30790 [Actinoplanes philippinensis]|uniref:DUF4331 domain-containing protein n=1 Tax=Actinoplanes philippinensis TaxID=35752 RepID=A0A1I2EC25_9ACTN|nr:DUF4331 domain-containing protein [Actinoplanes philippinensis]GIE77129.1 hypothetical protein Aph02nite_30790 [Actinoplanes philippinensis]SFE90028.1 protein of unknown function [Actinoplanes philippinensis]
MTVKPRLRRTLAALGAIALLGGSLHGLGPGTATASSHREAPLVAADPAIDNTDLYAFVSPERPGYVTFVANWQPFEEPNGGPNFYPFATDATYHIKVDNDGDARPDAEFKWKFRNIDKRGDSTFLYNNGPVTSLDDENLLFRQTYSLQSSFDGAPFQTRVEDVPVAPSRVGAASMPDYGTLRDQATRTLPGGWKIFAGQADDPFFLDLRVFDLLYGGDLSETGQDTLAGYNVNTIALQVPFKDVALKADAGRNPVIGVWTTTERNRVRITGGAQSGGKVQVSRLGNPLVNEVVVPASLKDTFNATPPERDAKIPALVKRVLEPEVPKLIESIYKIPAPKTPRNDLAEIFLTGITTKAGGPIKADLNSQLNNADVNASRFTPSEQLRLNLSVPVTGAPNRLGVLAGDLQGFPNGRRLTDDVVDIELQALVGAAQTGKLVDALAAGDAVDGNEQGFSGQFPYVALPNGVAVNSASRQPAAAAPPASGSSGSSAASGSAGVSASSGASGASGSSGASGASGSDAGAGAGPDAAQPAPDLAPVAVVTGASGVGLLIILVAAFLLVRWYRRRSTDPDRTLPL